MNEVASHAVLSRTLWARGGKRVFDVVVATLLLIVLSPVLLFAALLVKLSSAGPVFFRQDRGGKDGRIFRPFKFRTMRGERKPDPVELVPLEHTDITPVGRFMRRFKIDELPQMINVVRGEMSLVGPRPTLPEQVAAYDEFRRQRLLVRPGVTGLAQVYSSASASWDERIMYDIAYVRRCSPLLDVRIFARTLVTVLLGEQRTAKPFVESPFAHDVPLPPDFGRFTAQGTWE